MESISRLAGRRRGGSRTGRTASALSIALLAMSAAGGVQAATLSCGPSATPVRVHTSAAGWSSDVRYAAAPNNPATLRDDYLWRGWVKPAGQAHVAGAGGLAGTPLDAGTKWISFGDGQYPTGAGGTTGTGTYPTVSTRGKTAQGAWVQDLMTYWYKENITVDPNVDLSTIKVTGTGTGDDHVDFMVRAHVLPNGVDNSVLTTTPAWLARQRVFTNGWGGLQAINLDGSTQGLGFNHGDNTIGFVVWNWGATTASANDPTGVVADFQVTADCLTEPEPVATAVLSCAPGAVDGTPVQIGPFFTNARDWKWAMRTESGALVANTAPEQPLFDNYKYRDWFNPAKLPAGEATTARWISPGTTTPAARDLPGLPYPAATGQSKFGYYGSVFTMNQAITVADNVDLDSIKLTGRFAFDDTGDSVYVKPAAAASHYTPFKHLLPDGFGGFTGSVASPFTTGTIPGFEVGDNTIGLVLDGGQLRNDCPTGVCALGAIAEFKVTATCKAPAPNPETGTQTINFRAPNPGVYSATNGANVTWSPTPPLKSSADINVTYSTSTPGVCSVNASNGAVTLVTPAVAGNCTITANAAAGTWTDPNDSSHVVAISAAPPVTQTMVITLLKTQEITFLAQESRKVTDGPFAVEPAAQANSQLPVTYTSLTPAICSVTSDGTVTPKKNGVCTIAADQPGNAEYAAAERVTQDITLTDAPVVITQVPTLDVLGLGLLSLLGAGAGGLALRRRKRAE